jgi:hydrogenase expression/formation protein HypE
VLISGSIGDHGVAVMSKREDLAFDTEILSDSAPLHTLVAAMVGTVPDIHAMRDPTRGGLAAVLNEIARESRVGIKVDERAIPVATAVRGACELLGLDPLYVPNEGKLVAFCAAAAAEALLAAMRAHPLGQDAAIIGEVIDDPHRFVQMETAFGGNRIIDWLAGEQLPRIC